MEFEFSRFPVSYRFSQYLMLLVLISLASTAFGLMSKLPVEVRVLISCVCGLLVFVSFLLTAYVLIRYPYLSLVVPSDGDPFSQQQGTLLPRLVRIMNLLAILFMVVGSLISLSRGIDNVGGVVFVSYSVLMLPLLFFLLLFYSAESYPTLATLIRSTFGVGLLLFPIFFPFVMVGSLRCRQMLAEGDPNDVSRDE